MAQRGRPRKIRPDEFGAPVAQGSKDAVISASISVAGKTESCTFTVSNIGGYLVAAQRTPSAVRDVLAEALRARFGATVRLD